MGDDFAEVGDIFKVIFDILESNYMITEDQNKQIKERLTRGKIRGTAEDIQNFLGRTDKTKEV